MKICIWVTCRSTGEDYFVSIITNDPEKDVGQYVLEHPEEEVSGWSYE